MRLSRYAREIAPELKRCGYRVERTGGGHVVFVRDGFENFVVPSSPSDHRAFANDMARLRSRHPELFERRKSENRPSKRQRQERAARRASRSSLMPDTASPVVELEADEDEMVPHPGSVEARAAGCLCPMDQAYYGANPDDGEFAQVKFCPLHGWDDEQPEPVPDVRPRCVRCGDPFDPPRRGRPRKYCYSCKPSEWARLSPEQRAERTAYVLEWQHAHKGKR